MNRFNYAAPPKAKRVFANLKPRVSFDPNGSINLNRLAFDLLPIKPTKDAKIRVELDFSKDYHTLYIIPLENGLNGSPLTAQYNKTTGEISGGYLGPAEPARHEYIKKETHINLSGRFYSTDITTCQTDSDNPLTALGIILTKVIASTEHPKTAKDTTIVSEFTDALRNAFVSELESEDSSDEIQADIEPEEAKTSGISPLASAKVIKTVTHVNSRGLNGYGKPIK